MKIILTVATIGILGLLPMKATDKEILPVEIGKSYTVTFSKEMPTGLSPYPYLSNPQSITFLKHKGGNWYEISYDYYDQSQQDQDQRNQKKTMRLLLNLEYVATIQ